MAKPELFGTDGVRGIVGEYPLVPEFALQLGRAAGEVLASGAGRTTVVVGRDTRQSGPMLQNALTAGLLASGVDVLDAEVITTPGVSWLVRRLGAVAGAVISASHNPVEQNGIKFFGAGGQKLSEAVEVEIERLATTANPNWPARRPGRVLSGQAMHELYLGALLSEHDGLKLDGLTIAVDCANGAASQFAPELFARLGARVVAVNASPTGMNINAEAGSEYVRQSPEKMARLIRDYQANFGVAFDGDADRAIFIDNEGAIVDGDHMLGMLAKYLGRHGRLLCNAVVTTVMRNAGLRQYVETSGMTLYETPVGDKYVVEKLLELQQSAGESRHFGLGGEQSGHIVLLNGEHATGDGMRTALYVLRAFIESGQPTMAVFADGIGKTPQVIASADVGRGPRLDRAALDKMQNDTLAQTPGLTRINLRYSGTEPKFRAMLEAESNQTEESLAALALRICRHIQQVADVGYASVEIQNCTRGGLLLADLIHRQSQDGATTKQK